MSSPSLTIAAIQAIQEGDTDDEWPQLHPSTVDDEPEYHPEAGTEGSSGNESDGDEASFFLGFGFESSGLMQAGHKETYSAHRAARRNREDKERSKFIVNSMRVY